jgi:rare lipoprotein A
MIGRAIALTFCVLVGTLSFIGLANAGRATAVAKTASASADAASGGAKASGQTGLASVYGFAGDKSAGGKTANGERVRATEMSAAHRTFAFGTRVRVTNLRNGLSAVVRINDRGPFVRGRVIDLTPAAAKAIGFSAHREGLARVALSVEKD